jgi:hypothetical protein
MYVSHTDKGGRNIQTHAAGVGTVGTVKLKNAAWRNAQ